MPQTILYLLEICVLHFVLKYGLLVFIVVSGNEGSFDASVCLLMAVTVGCNFSLLKPEAKG